MKLTKSDWAVLGALGAWGVFIWVRDLRWWAASDDTLPILAALPLFYWLGRPWVPTERNGRLRPRPALLAAFLFPLGIVADSGLILAAGWTALLWSWVAGRFEPASGTFRQKLLVLPLLSFPWLVTDFETVAWWFRLSGAAATEWLLTWLHVPVVREGTLLWCNHLAISVEPACSGVNGLQSMLVAGSALLYLKLSASRLYWWNLPLLVGAAWLAHVFRITTAGLCGVVLTPDAATRWVGPIHAFTGWLGLLGGFACCHLWFSVQARWRERRRASGQTSAGVRLPWMNFALLLYGAFCARGLVASWRWAPYDRWAWLAFLIWLAPLVWPGRRTATCLSQRHGSLLTVACGLLLVAAAADIHAIYHAALAVVLVGLYRRNGPWLPWALGAVAWMPAAGWLGSRWRITPETFLICRTVTAAVAAACGLAGSWRPANAATSQISPASPATLLRRTPRHAE